MAKNEYPHWFTEIYSNHQFDTPIIITNDEKYIEELQKKYNELILLFQSNPNTESGIVDHIQTESSRIIEILTFYLQGKMVSAIDALNTYIEPILTQKYFVGSLDNLRGIKIKTEFHTGEGTNENLQLDLFHARVNYGKKPFAKDDMLHIPFNERNKVAMQRFSVPGIPFYYLGTSSYVCWQELGCPSEDQFEVSFAELDSSLSFLDLTMNVSLMRGASEEINKLEIAEKWLSLWLLVIATSFKIYEADSRKFKSEYILSNLLAITLCENSSIDGIIYNSKRLRCSDIHTFPIGMNVVLFSRPSQNILEGYSKVFEKIELSNPVNFYEFKQFKYPEKIHKKDISLFADQCSKIPTWDGIDSNGVHCAVLGYYGDVDWKEKPQKRLYTINSNTTIANYRMDYADTIFHDFDLYLKNLPRSVFDFYNVHN